MMLNFYGRGWIEIYKTNKLVHRRIILISIVIMFVTDKLLLPVEVLLQIIFKEYLLKSYCITVVTETSINFDIDLVFTYMIPSQNEDSFVNQLLNVSEMGCSDYVVRMEEPGRFMENYEKVTHLGVNRRGDRKLIFMPPGNDNDTEILLSILEMKSASFVPNILLIIPESTEGDCCESFGLVTHKYVGSDDNVTQPDNLNRWNSCTEKFDQNSNLFPHDISNLGGKTVKVAAFTYKPYSILDLDPKFTPNGRDGTEVRIVDEFCKWVNCTIEMVRDDVHQWGEIFDNRTGVGVIGNVVEDRADMGISALYSWYEEFIYLDFSIPTIRTAITCIAPAPRLLASWEMPLLPFSWIMWLLLMITFLYAAIAVSMAQGCSTDRAFLTTFGMMIAQSQDSAGRSWRVRSVTGWLLITGLVLDNAYGAGLASTFTVPKFEPSIDKINDIIEKKMEWGATHDAWIFSLLLSSEPQIKQLVSLFKIHTADELKRLSFTRDMAYSIEKLPAGYFAIGEYITKDAVPNLMVMLEDFYYEQAVVMLRKSSPYTRKMSQLLGILHESGLLMAWETQVALQHLDFKVQLEVKLSRSMKDVEETGSLTLRHVMGVFFLYFFGLTISSIIFLVEYFSKRRLKVEDEIVTVLL